MNKTCTKCGVEKPIEDFPIAKANRARRQRFDRVVSRCKFCTTAYQREWRLEKLQLPEYKAQQQKAGRDYYHAHRCKVLSYSKKHNDNLRAEILESYGGKCNCCGEAEPSFLALDHVNNDGKTHRKLVGPCQAVYRDVKRRGFPKNEFQLLCHNCNWSKKLFGVCAHKLKSLAA